MYRADLNFCTPIPSDAELGAAIRAAPNRKDAVLRGYDWAWYQYSFAAQRTHVAMQAYDDCLANLWRAERDRWERPLVAMRDLHEWLARIG